MLQSFYPGLCASLGVSSESAHTCTLTHTHSYMRAGTHIHSHSHDTHALLTHSHTQNSHIHTRTHSWHTTHPHTHPDICADTLTHIHKLSPCTSSHSHLHTHTHPHTCTLTRSCAHTHPHTHTLACSHAHTFVYSHHHRPLPAGWFVLKLLTAQSGELVEHSHPDGWGGAAGEGRSCGPYTKGGDKIVSLSTSWRGALRAPRQGVTDRSLGDGQNIPAVSPGHGSLLMACLSRFPFSLGSRHFLFSIESALVESSWYAGPLATALRALSGSPRGPLLSPHFIPEAKQTQSSVDCHSCKATRFPGVPTSTSPGVTACQLPGAHSLPSPYRHPNPSRQRRERGRGFPSPYSWATCPPITAQPDSRQGKGGPPGNLRPSANTNVDGRARTHGAGATRHFIFKETAYLGSCPCCREHIK